MKKFNNKIKNPLSMLMYIIAIFLGLYTIFTMYNSYAYISNLVDQGFVITDDIKSVVTYCVGASVPYLFYTIAILSIGYIINKLNYIINEIKLYNNEIIREDVKLIDDNITINEKIRIEESSDDINDKI